MKIATLVKTGNGPLWIVPLVLAARERGHEVVVLLPPPDHVRSELAAVLAGHGVAAVAAPAPVRRGWPIAQLVGVVRLRALLRRLDVDVVNYHLYASALAVRFATLGTRIVRVHTVAGPLYLENRVIRRLERVLCRLDDVLVATTGDIRDRYLALGVPRRAVREVPYGVDLHRFVPASASRRRAARAELGLAPDEFVAVCVAYFYPPKRTVLPGRGVKGHDVLLRAWARFVAAGGSGTLLLVGGGYQDAGERYRRRLREWAAGLGGAGSVRWLDSVGDVRPFYAAADVNVVASWSEGYGASMEASACGVPTVATAVGGLPEIVDDQTGWTVAAGDAPAMAAALAAAAAAHGTSALADRAAAARARAEKLLDRDALRFDAMAVLARAGREGREPVTGARFDAAVAGLPRPARLAAVLTRKCWHVYLAKSDPVEFARRIGVRVGRDCRFVEIDLATFGTEPYLVTLGDEVGIAGGVRFVTHDGSVTRLRGRCPDIDVVAPIVVGDRVIFGLNVVVLPGVTIGDDVLVTTGSVVTRDVPPGSVVAGTPARVVSSVEDHEKRLLARSLGTGQLSPADKRRVFLDRFGRD